MERREKAMSQFSGKCDFYDHFSSHAMHPRPNNPMVLESNDIEAFEIFKKKTGGVIYRNVRIDLTKYNIEYELKTNPLLERKTEEIKYIAEDKKSQNSDNQKREKTKVIDHYFYCGREMTLKQINKLGYTKKVEIHFDTIYDLIPYFPHLVSSCFSSRDKEIVTITEYSFADEEEKEMYKYGIKNTLGDHYRKELAKYWIKTVKSEEEKK